MTEKQYRLNKWSTRLLKNNRPLFDWTNEADEIVDLLNELNDVNVQLKKSVKRQQDSNNECAKLIKEQQKENEQLKSYTGEMEDYLARLEEKNEQLKEELADANELNRIYVDFLVDKGFELSDVVEWSKKELQKND